MSAPRGAWLTRQCAAYAGVLRSGPFATLAGSAMLSTAANTLIGLLLVVYVYDRSGSSGLAVGVLFVVNFLPNLVVAPLCSGIADRVNRRVVLAGCDAVRVLLCLLLLVNWPIPVLLLLAFCATSASAVSKPARYALVPRLCPPDRLVSANALLMMGGTAAILLSGLLAAVALSSLGRGGFLLAAGCALGAALLSACYPRVGTGSEHEQPAPDVGDVVAAGRGRLRRGLAHVTRHPLLRMLTITTTLLWLGLGAQESLLIVFVDRALDEPSSTYPLLVTLGAVGGLVGTAATPLLATDRRSTLRAFGTSLVLAGGVFAVFAYAATGALSAFVLFGLFSLAYAVANVLDEYLEQDLTPDGLRATVIAAIGSIGTAGYLVGGALGAPLADAVGARPVAAVIAVVILVAGALSLALMRDPTPAPQPARVAQEARS